jgi:hypothetical protein
VVEYQSDFFFASGASQPQGWMVWDELTQASPQLDGNTVTYPFNIAEINQRYWVEFQEFVPLLTTANFAIVKDLNNVRLHVFLDNGLDQKSAKTIFWYPVVPGNPE